MSNMGRPRIQITRELLVKEYEKHQRWDKVAESIGVSHSTVARRVAEYGIRRVYTKVK